MKSVKLVGILNCSPDSFSDRSPGTTPDQLIARGHALIADGAMMLDIGGDSTRPGSICVQPAEEWRRIEPIVQAFAQVVPVSIDTHHTEVARRALAAGVAVINDVSGGIDPSLVETVRSFGARYVVMYSASGRPHMFEDVPADRVVDVVDKWCEERLKTLSARGIETSNVILDTGMGAFISRDASASFALLSQYGRFGRHGCGLMLCCSRKGFLKHEGEKVITDRDHLSALCAVKAFDKLPDGATLYVRAHDIRTHRAAFDISARID